MATFEEFVQKQKDHAQFVVTAQMLRLSPEKFDALAQVWIDDGGPGFNVIGMPHRTVVNGEFFISRVTVIKTRSSST